MGKKDFKESMVLSIETKETYDILSDTEMKSVHLLMSVDQLRSGVISKLSTDSKKSNTGARNLAVLLIIAAHMNFEGKSFPSQTRIAELTGLTRQTVAKAISDLENVLISGKPVLSKQLVPNGKGSHKTIYQLNGVPQDSDENYFEKTAEPQLSGVEDPMTSKSVLLLFMDEYEKAFGFKYVPNFGRDMGQIKQKLIGKFSDEELRAAVIVAISQYSEKWKSSKYPYPTIGMLTTWLINEAVKLVHIKKDQEQKFDARVAEAEKYEEINPLDLLG